MPWLLAKVIADEVYMAATGAREPKNPVPMLKGWGLLEGRPPPPPPQQQQQQQTVASSAVSGRPGRSAGRKRK